MSCQPILHGQRWENVLSSAVYFQTKPFKKNSFRNIIRVSNGLDTDQARCFVGPDLPGPKTACNGFQLSAIAGNDSNANKFYAVT